MKLLILLALSVFFISVLHANLLGRKQRVKAKGRLLCGDKPAYNVTVKLMDEDDGGIDDQMDQIQTDREGNFHLNGEESELSNIDPVVKVYHDCNDGVVPCQRKWSIKIPNSYINSNKTMEMGIWNLEAIMNSETRDCIH